MAGLTVVVPTIPGRESLLSRCLFHLTGQASDGVEILVVEGPGRLGDKVNAAVEVAAGDYLTVVDDDDWVTVGYVAAVLAELDTDPDFVGLKVLELHNGRFHGVTAVSAEWARWGSDGRRGPTPKGVTRTAIWRDCPFGNAWKADRLWRAEVSARVRSWRFIDACLYVYDYWDAASAFTGKGTRDVGVWPFDESMVRRIAL